MASFAKAVDEGEEAKGSVDAVSFDATTKAFKEWAAFFHAHGYIILNNALAPEMIQRLRDDLQKRDASGKGGRGGGRGGRRDAAVARHVVHKRFFEHSKATVDLVEDSVVTDFAQYLIHDVPGGRGNSLTAHLIHNNAFTVPPNGRGQAPSWHTDDPLQQVILPKGRVLPEWIKLPVLVCTYMIWLSDCPKEENGPTRIVPGSHRWGEVVDPAKAEPLGIAACGKAGTAVLVNSQTWHRGSENTSSVPRATLQLTFGRRIIGHKHDTIMNYVMPPHVLRGRHDKTYERFGFLQGGAYS